MKRVPKNKWARLCEDISQTCHFCRTEIVRIDADGEMTQESDASPLLSIGLVRRKGKISAIEAKVGQIRSGSPTAVILMLGAPVSMVYGPSGDVNVLEIENEDGYKMTVRIFPESARASYKSFVNKMAYVLSQARGFAPGRDQEDWFLAERLIRKSILKNMPPVNPNNQ